MQFRLVSPPRTQLLRLFIIVGTMLFAPLWAAGATAEASDYLMDLWTSDNDLPDSSVTAITQTPDGYIWIGTYNGLARFDGVRFVTFDPVNTPELKHARISNLFTDAHGTLWINTYDGSMTSLRNGVFTHEWQGGVVSDVFCRSNQTFFTTYFSVVCRTEDTGGHIDWRTININQKTSAVSYRQDAQGGLWFMLFNGRVGRLTGTNAMLLPDGNGVDHERVNWLTTDRDHTIWVGTDRKIARWNGNRFENETPTNGEKTVNAQFLFCTDSNNLWAIANGTVRHAVDRQWTTTIDSWPELLTDTLYVDAYGEKNGGTWMWFRQLGHGLFHANAEGKAERISSANGLPSNLVRCWFQDREGNIWVGIDRGGLVRLRKKQFQVIGTAEGLKTSAVSTVCEDGHSNIWIGVFDGGLNRWHDGKLDHFDLPGAGNLNSFFSVCPDDQDRLWISANREDLYVFETNTIVRRAEAVHGIKAIMADHRGQIWMGQQRELSCLADGQLSNFGPWNGFVRRDIRALAEDRNGVIWIGMGNGVLYKFDKGQFTAFKPNDGVEEQSIWSLLPDDDGNIWVGTFRGGLLRFKDGKFTRYTTKDGLPSDVICQILEDGQGKLWIGSHKGIFYVSKAALSAFDRGQLTSLPCTAYGLYDGLPTLECSGNYQPSCWRGHDGKLWFATSRGAVMVDPQAIHPNPLAPPVLIEDFLVDGKNPGTTGTNTMASPQANPAAGLRTGDVFRSPPGRHQFDFHFTALSFTAPDKVRFRYKLKGFDNAWVEAGTKRTAHYGPLQPGEYHFQVIACNNDGVWNEQGASIIVKQLPFFWQTWWFLSLVGVTIIGAISAAVRHAATRSLEKKLERLKEQRAIERERERIAKDIHDDLGAGLTQIMLQSSIARRESQGQMQTDLTQISETARELVRTMDEIVWAINPENDSLDGLVTYAGKFVQEYLAMAKLRCRLDLPAQLPAIDVSAEGRHNLFLAIKEALNNVVKHAQATEVSFQLKIQEAAFSFIITDNGRGFTPGAPSAATGDHARISSGHGLRNLARRLAEMGGNCAIRSEPGNGTQVELTVPIRNQGRLN